MSIPTYDIVVVGYGVSGLCLASILNPNIKTLIIEHGKPHLSRNHDDATDALIGCGGAGLFSDGKFSFYPAGTAVWNLSKANLDKSRDNLESDLSKYIDFDKAKQDQREMTNVNDACRFKYYPSYYLSLQERMELIGNLADKSPHQVIYDHLVTDILVEHDKYIVSIKNDSTVIDVQAKYIVFAGGRFSPVYFPELSRVFRRIEYGARIVATSDNAAMVQSGINDPKYIFNTDDYEARTFCWCKNGEYILTDNAQGIQTYSGRSDIAKTDSTNFGFNIRIKSECENHLQNLLSIRPFSIATKDLTDKQLAGTLGQIMGEEYGKYFHEALEKLLGILPALRNNITIVGPTLEGVGYYPNVNTATLQIHNENIFCCGDASGIFRGIIPAMISGYHVAHTLNDLIKK